MLTGRNNPKKETIKIMKNKQTYIALSLLFSVTVAPFSVNAASAVSNVGGATVTEGKTSVEFRFGATEDDSSSSNDKRYRMRQHIDHGFNDWYALRALVAQDKRKNDNLEHQSFTLENRFQLIEKRDYGWDGGFRLSYAQSDGDKKPHEVVVRLVAEADINDKWKIIHNTFFSHDIGAESEDGASAEIRHRLIRKMDVSVPYIEGLALGVDMMNDFGRLKDLSGYSNQDHQIGPIAKISFSDGVALQTTYRTAISSAGVDNTFGLFVSKSF